MMIGTVIGQISLDRAVAGAEQKRFVQVRCGYALVTALDPVGVRDGEMVLVAAGDSAVRMCPEVSVDAVVLGALTA